MTDNDSFQVTLLSFFDIEPYLDKKGDGPFSLNSDLFERYKHKLWIPKYGLFYQLENLKNADASVPSRFREIEELLYIDFSLKKNSPDSLTKSKTTIKRLFEKGISITFERTFNFIGKGVTYHFLPFEKSASMGRDSKMAFVSRRGYTISYNEIDGFQARLYSACFLGMNEIVAAGEDEKSLSKADPLAKRYSYRGLLLSGGDRVDLDYLERRFGISLNEKTVLIVPDNEVVVENVSYVTQKAKGKRSDNDGLGGGAELIDDAGKCYCEFENKPEKRINVSLSINTNDGYGFMSPRLALAISRLIHSDSDLSTIQIRLPFIKGILNKVDFAQFAIDHQKDGETIDVVHFDGDLERTVTKMKSTDLGDIQMILTESMFKCISELRDFHGKYKNTVCPDAISYYWEKIKEYRHSLFVVSYMEEESALSFDTGSTSLNSQFLSTSRISLKSLETLLKRSIDKHNNLLNDDKYRWMRFYDERFEGIDPCLISDKKKCTFFSDDARNRAMDISTAERMIITNNQDAIFEPHFVNLLRAEAKSVARSLGQGRIEIGGCDRFLCGDPLQLLYFVFNLEWADCKRISFERGYSFVAPNLLAREADGSLLKVPNGKECAILRNPHLSHNEDLVLKYFVPNEDDERNKYGLNELTNLCMVDPTDSCLPSEVIGGADYDGDHVKIIVSDVYSSALKAHAALPVVINKDYRKQHSGSLNIEDFSDTPSNKAKVTLSTFDSSVGSISNLAFKESLKAYQQTPYEDEIKRQQHEDNVILLGIFTGLETDSGKTGIKPYYKNMKNVIDTNSSIVGSNGSVRLADMSSYYIDFKSMLDGDENMTSGAFKARYDDKVDAFKCKGCGFFSLDSLNKCPHCGGAMKKTEHPFLSSEMPLSDYHDAFFKHVGRSPSPVELLIPAYFNLSSNKQKKVYRQNRDLIDWARPGGDGNDIDGDSLSIVRKVIASYFYAKNIMEKSKRQSQLISKKANYLFSSVRLTYGIGVESLVRRFADFLIGDDVTDQEMLEIKELMDEGFFTVFVYDKNMRLPFFEKAFAPIFGNAHVDSMFSECKDLFIKDPLLLKRAVDHAFDSKIKDRCGDNLGRDYKKEMLSLLESLPDVDDLAIVDFCELLEGSLSEFIDEFRNEATLSKSFTDSIKWKRAASKIRSKLCGFFLNEASCLAKIDECLFAESTSLVHYFEETFSIKINKSIVSKLMSKYLASSLLHSYEITPTTELIDAINKYRCTCDSKYDKELLSEMINQIKDFNISGLNEVTDSQIETSRRLSDELRIICRRYLLYDKGLSVAEAFACVRALQDEIDHDQRFLWDFFTPRELSAFYLGGEK